MGGREGGREGEHSVRWHVGVLTNYFGSPHSSPLLPSLPPSFQAKQGSTGGFLSFLYKTPLIYILRWIRLTPTYFFVLLMYWYVPLPPSFPPSLPPSLPRSLYFAMDPLPFLSPSLFLRKVLAVAENDQASIYS